MSNPRAVKAALEKEKELKKARAAKRAAEEDARQRLKYEKELAELQQRKARQVLLKFRAIATKGGDDEEAAELAAEAPSHLLAEPLGADGMTLLHKAAAGNMVNLTRVILQRSDLPSTLISMVDANGRTALHCAAPSDTTGEICAEIVGMPGCKIRALDNEDRTALEIAQERGMTGAAAAILRASLPPLPPSVVRRLKGLPEEEPRPASKRRKTKTPETPKRRKESKKDKTKKDVASQPVAADVAEATAVAAAETAAEATPDAYADGGELGEVTSEMEAAAVKIQAVQRGRQSRRSTFFLRVPPEEQTAATKIQASPASADAAAKGTAAAKRIPAIEVEEESEEDDQDAMGKIDLDHNAGLKAVTEGRRDDALRLACFLGWPFVNERDPKQGRTLLHWAAAKGFADVCTAMLQREEFLLVNAFDKDRATALHLATASCNLNCVVAIVDSERFTAVNERDLCDRTALHLAALRGNSECCEVIASHPDCDAFLPDCHGKCAAEYAVERGIDMPLLPLPEPLATPVDL